MLYALDTRIEAETEAQYEGICGTEQTPLKRRLLTTAKSPTTTTVEPGVVVTAAMMAGRHYVRERDTRVVLLGIVRDPVGHLHERTVGVRN